MLEFHIQQAEQLLTEDGDSFAQDFHASKVIEAARAYLKLTENPDLPAVPVDEAITRQEDMGSGLLQLYREPDGDICVAVITEQSGMASIQFCTSVIGGGRSPKVLKALYGLAQAMIEENEANPLHL